MALRRARVAVRDIARRRPRLSAQRSGGPEDPLWPSASQLAHANPPIEGVTARASALRCRHVPRDLPPDLTLPLASGAPSWYWAGGRPAIDLVNTLRERWNRRVETLVTEHDLALWLERTGLTSGPAEVDRALLRDTRELRGAIDAAITAVVDGDPPPIASVSFIDGWLGDAATRPVLRIGDDGLPELAEVPATGRAARRAVAGIALDAGRLLADPAQRRRVRVCASPTCSARFYDRSAAGSRRWCSMRTCGNVAKVRRHRARAAGGGGRP